MFIVDGIEIVTAKELHDGTLWEYTVIRSSDGYESPDGMLSYGGSTWREARYVKIRVVSVRQEGDQFHHEVELELGEDCPDSYIAQAFVEGHQPLERFVLNGYQYPEDFVDYWTRDSEEGKKLVVDRVYRGKENPQELLDRGEFTLAELVELLKKYEKTSSLRPEYFNIELLRQIHALDPEVIPEDIRRRYNSAEQQQVFGQVDYNHLALTAETAFEDAVQLIEARGALDWDDMQALPQHARAEELVRLIAEQDATLGINNGRNLGDEELFKVYAAALVRTNPASPLISKKLLEALPDGFEGAPDVFDFEIKRMASGNALPRSITSLAQKFGQKPTNEQLEAIEASKHTWCFHWICLADREQARQVLLAADQDYLHGIYADDEDRALAQELLSAEEYRRLFKEVAVARVEHFLGNDWVENRKSIAELEREFNPEPEAYEEMIRSQVLGDPEHDGVLKLVYPEKCSGIIDRISHERRVPEVSFDDARYHLFWNFKKGVTRAELKEILRADKRIFTKIRCDATGDRGIKVDNLSKFLFGVPGRHGAIKVETSKRQTDVWIKGEMSRLAKYILNTILAESGQFDARDLDLCRVDILRRRDRLMKEGDNQ